MTGKRIAADRVVRVIALVATGVIALFAVAVVVTIWNGAAGRGELGWDAALYARNAGRWLATGEAYRAYQLHGPYPGIGEANLYPPLALYLFVPFVWLPGVLWWAVPMAIVGAVFAVHRPPTWTWPIFAAVCATVPFGSMIAYGNSSLWALAIIAMATLRPAAAVLLAFKPSVFPIAFLFAFRRSWWVAAAVVALAAIPFGLTAWVEWTVISRNLEGSTFLYSANFLPLFAAPILAWLTGIRSPLRDRALPVGQGSVVTAPSTGPGQSPR